MAVSTSPFVVGEKVTAAKLNAYQAAIAEQQAFNNRTGVLLVPTTNQTVAAGTLVTLQNWVVSGPDAYGYYDSTTPTRPIKIPAGLAGQYVIKFRYRHSGTSSGHNTNQIILNGSTTDVERGSWDNDIVNTVTTVKYLGVGDQLSAQVFAAVAGSNSLTSTEFSAFRFSL